MGEFKVEGLRLSDFSGTGQVLHQGHKLMVVPTVIVELWGENIAFSTIPQVTWGLARGLQEPYF